MRAATPSPRSAKPPPRAAALSRAHHSPSAVRVAAPRLRSGGCEMGIGVSCGLGFRNEVHFCFASETGQTERRFPGKPGLETVQDVPRGLGPFQIKRTRPNTARRRTMGAGSSSSVHTRECGAGQNERERAWSFNKPCAILFRMIR
jgi:hypothetical protein